ncbi:MFS transporter [Clostridium magnum]|uniref:Hexuronate transporter n=1 Tax=Clostridium magnum DSM 2767 TaxID=1121326 RepID=A0A162RNB3_9CLOT|nr:MFS transporter [Clostridium magnum]KZL90159.1 hexuronate transporter [Clostridium magnum DSM 2767]SHH62695.1 Sugar phosphate permease [Clostridium magnum DSM 2767]
MYHYEEKTEIVKPKRASKESWIALTFLWIIFAINANGRELTNRVLPYISNTYNIGPDKAGLIGTVCGITMALGAIPLARWFDNGEHGWATKKRGCIISMSYVVFMALTGITPLTGTFTMILIWQGLRGFFSAPGECGEVGSVAEWWPREKTGFAIGIHHAAYPWGSLIGGIIISGVLMIFGDSNWRYAFLVFPIIAIVTWFAYYKWATLDRYKNFEQHTRASGFTCPLDYDPSEESVSNGSSSGSLIRCLKNPNISAVALVAFLCQFAYIAFLFWMPAYLAFVANYSYAAAASLSVVYAITGGLGQIFWGNYSDKIGPKKTMIICCIWLAIAFYLMQFITISLFWLVALQLLLGCCSNAVYPVMYKYVAESSERGAIVTGNGVLTTGMFSGAAVATLVTGWLIQLGGGWSSMSGYYAGLYTMTGAMILALAVVILFTRETNGPKFKKDFSLVSLKSCNLDKE